MNIFLIHLEYFIFSIFKQLNSNNKTGHTKILNKIFFVEALKPICITNVSYLNNIYNKNNKNNKDLNEKSLNFCKKSNEERIQPNDARGNNSIIGPKVPI